MKTIKIKTITKTGAILVSIALLLGMTAYLPVTSLAADSIRIAVNGKTVAFPDVQPFTDANGRAFVPVRFLSEELGCDVNWNSESQTVTIERGLIHARLTIGQEMITVLNFEKTMDTAAQVLDGRTLVPVRFAAEAFGCEVAWDAAARTVAITDSGRDIYRVGDITIDVEEGDKLIDYFSGFCIAKKSGLILKDEGSDSSPVLRFRSVADSPGKDIDAQRMETESMLKQCLDEELADEIMAHVSQIKTKSDKIEYRSWQEGKYLISAFGASGESTILVYMDYDPSGVVDEIRHGL